MKCPICKKEVSVTPHKSWHYKELMVNRYNCPECNKKFNAYDKDGDLRYTIPKMKQ